MDSVVLDCLNCNKRYNSMLPEEARESADHLLILHDTSCPLCGQGGIVQVVNFLNAQHQ